MQLIEVSGSNEARPPSLLITDIPTLVVWSKLVLMLVGFALSILFQIWNGNFVNHDLWFTIYPFFVLQLGAHLFVIMSLKNDQRLPLAIAIAAVLDAVLIGAFVAAFGQTLNVFLFFFLMNIALTGFYFGTKGALAVALFSAAVFNFVLAVDFDFAAVDLTGALFTHTISFFAVGLFAGFLKSEVSKISTELESKDEDIKSLKDLNQLVIENVGSGLLSVDRHLKITQANRAAAKLFSDISLVGKKLQDVVPQVKEKIDSGEIRVIEGAVDRFEINYSTYVGDRMILEVIASPLMRKPYGHQGFVLLFQNLTEQKNFESALRQQEKMAAIGAMAAGIAHEIRNPLASISGSVQLLAGSLKSDSSEDKKLVAIMIKEIDRLNKLIAEFLEFVRPPMKLDDPVSLANLAKEVVDIARLNRDLPAHVKVTTDLPDVRTIPGHYDKLKQAVLNIIINAYQACEKVEQAEIRVKLSEENEKITLSISDNGSGMTKEALSRLFVPFHTTKQRGTGLGLAISHKIFEAHDASVIVESELNQGTTFHIEFNQPRSQS